MYFYKHHDNTTGSKVFNRLSYLIRQLFLWNSFGHIHSCFLPAHACEALDQYNWHFKCKPASTFQILLLFPLDWMAGGAATANNVNYKSKTKAVDQRLLFFLLFFLVFSVFFWERVLLNLKCRQAASLPFSHCFQLFFFYQLSLCECECFFFWVSSNHAVLLSINACPLLPRRLSTFCSYFISVPSDNVIKVQLRCRTNIFDCLYLFFFVVVFF